MPLRGKKKSVVVVSFLNAGCEKVKHSCAGIS